MAAVVFFAFFVLGLLFLFVGYRAERPFILVIGWILAAISLVLTFVPV